MNNSNLISAFKELLMSEQYSSQIDMVKALHNLGFHTISQPRISKMISKIGAIRGKNVKGEMVYKLPKNIVTPTSDSKINNLIVDIDHNDTMIVVKTIPAAAQLIALLLDELGKSEGILGTIAGDDTIFIAPTKESSIIKTLHNIKKVFSQNSF